MRPVSSSTDNFPLEYLLLIVIITSLQKLFSPKYHTLYGTLNIEKKNYVSSIELRNTKYNYIQYFKRLFIKKGLHKALLISYHHSPIQGYFIVRKRWFLNFIFAYVSETGDIIYFKEDMIHPYTGLQKAIISLVFLTPVAILAYLGIDGAYIGVTRDIFYQGMTAIILLLYFWIINVSQSRLFQFLHEEKLITDLIL